MFDGMLDDDDPAQQKELPASRHTVSFNSSRACSPA